MKGQFLIDELLATPWALRREVLSAYVQLLARWISTDREPVAESSGPPSMAFDARRRDANARVSAAGIAVIPVMGPIVQRAGMMTDWCGGTACNQVGATLADALADDSVGQILIEFDSPGGSVYGVDELAAQIFQARQIKPVVGIANSLAASAGYYLLSQCGEAYVTPGGEVGSIGVWMAHEDWSKALESAGVNTTLISAGKYKVEGNPYAPLDAEARDFLQERVDAYYGAFVKAVARGRGCGVEQVRSGMGQGRVLGAADALAGGMVDGVLTLTEVIRKMQRDSRAVKPVAASKSALSAARLAIDLL